MYYQVLFFSSKLDVIQREICNRKFMCPLGDKEVGVFSINLSTNMYFDMVQK